MTTRLARLHVRGRLFVASILVVALVTLRIRTEDDDEHDDEDNCSTLASSDRNIGPQSSAGNRRAGSLQHLFNFQF